jgi:hypothetical protein
MTILVGVVAMTALLVIVAVFASATTLVQLLHYDTKHGLPGDPTAGVDKCVARQGDVACVHVRMGGGGR